MLNSEKYNRTIMQDLDDCFFQVVTLGCGSVGDGVKWELREGAGEYDMTVSIHGEGRVKQFSRNYSQSRREISDVRSRSWFSLAYAFEIRYEI